MKTLIAKLIIIIIITTPIGLFIVNKFGQTANTIYWVSLIIGSLIQQIIWNFWE